MSDLDDLIDDTGAPTDPDAGAVSLDRTRDFISRYVALPSDAALTAVTLWVAAAHAAAHFHVFGRLALVSPEPECGKSRCLEVIELLTPQALLCGHATAPAIFRRLEHHPEMILLLDEADNAFRNAEKSEAAADLATLLNMGYRRGAVIPRCVGTTHKSVDFPVFCPVALAGIGDLPRALMTRSLVIRMRRRAPQEYVEPFRLRVAEPAGHAVRDALAAWIASLGPAIGTVWPSLPAGVEDRQAEIWEPLLAIADAAGAEWPSLARQACATMVLAARDDDQSLGVLLLKHLRIVFSDAPVRATADILDRLIALDEAPWGNLQGRPIDARRLAKILKPYGVRSRKVRIGDAVLQGYSLDSLADAFVRYLADVPEQTEQAEHSSTCNGLVVPDVPFVPEHRPDAVCGGGADEKPQGGPGDACGRAIDEEVERCW